MGKWHKGQHAYHEAPFPTRHLINPRLTIGARMRPQQWPRLHVLATPNHV